MKKKILIITLFIILVGSYIAWSYYGKIFNANTKFSEGQKEFFVSTGSNFDDMTYNLKADEIVDDIESFKETAELKKFESIKPGRYVFLRGMSNQEMINKLRNGEQDAVKLTFNSARTKMDIAGKISRNIELDSVQVYEILTDKEIVSKYGFNSYTFSTMFIPNTYEVYWNISSEGLLDRFAKEYKSFWNDDRKAKAKALNLSQSEVTILASIVKAETAKADEAPKVAGLYINRLRKKMLLQADPTLIFALGDFSIKRVLNEHKLIDSPYNTYMHTGLPPGPINIPSPVYIDAVLNYVEHDYIFMCAKADFSGYHHFAKTNAQHEVYAREYRRALKKAGM